MSLRVVLVALSASFVRSSLEVLGFSCLIAGYWFVWQFSLVLCKFVVGFIELLLEVFGSTGFCVVCPKFYAGFIACLLFTHHVYVLLYDK